MSRQQEFDLNAMLPAAWDLQWKRAQAMNKGHYRDILYITATDMENQVRAFCRAQLDGKDWRKIKAKDAAWGRGYGDRVRVHLGGRLRLLDACRAWLQDQERMGKLASHNFGRGHISGARYRPAGVKISEAEAKTIKRREAPYKPAPVHAREGFSRSSAVLCVGKAPYRGGFRRSTRTTEVRAEVTCVRCLNKLASKEPVRVYFAPKVEVIDKPGYGPTLGGDVDRLVEVVRSYLDVTRPVARELVSTACERIEQAAEGGKAKELAEVTARDIVERAREVHFDRETERLGKEATRQGGAA